VGEAGAVVRPQTYHRLFIRSGATAAGRRLSALADVPVVLAIFEPGAGTRMIQNTATHFRSENSCEQFDHNPAPGRAPGLVSEEHPPFLVTSILGPSRIR
jgi:hypothetical protein